MPITSRLPLAAVLGSLMVTGAMAGPYDTKAVLTGKLGDEVYLMTAEKMTLYTFDKDANGVSACYDACAVNWPPLTAEAGTSLPSGYSLVARTDGTMQIAYKGKPLYLWVNDHNPGDMTGDGIKGVWHTARP